jgi:predicted amino acid dehydrogenase
VIRSVYDTALGQIAHIAVPCFTSELYTAQERLIARMSEALVFCSRLGVQVVSLTGLLASATDYGRSLAARCPSGLRITTGHAVTAAAVVMALERALELGGRRFADERMAVVGVGSIGMGALRVLLQRMPHPKELVLCDVFGKAGDLEVAARELRDQLRFAGPIRCLPTQGQIDPEIYRCGVILGATNVADVLDATALAPGAILVDDSSPHCFDVAAAIARFEAHADILFTEGGILHAPDQIREIRYMPRDPESSVFFTSLQRFDRAPDELLGCLFSGLLNERFKDLPLILGPVDAASGVKTFDRLRETGFAAPTRLSCLNYRLSLTLLERFRHNHAATSRR